MKCRYMYHFLVSHLWMLFGCENLDKTKYLEIRYVSVLNGYLVRINCLYIETQQDLV